MSRHNTRLIDPARSMDVHHCCRIHRQVLKDFPALRGKIRRVWLAGSPQEMSRYQFAFCYEAGILYLDLWGGVALVVLGK